MFSSVLVGIDSHRVWEILHFGCIPIVTSSSLDSLYRQFPIIIVSHWSELLRPHALEEHYSDVRRQFGEDPWLNHTLRSKLTMDYWIRQVHLAQSSLLGMDQALSR